MGKCVISNHVITGKGGDGNTPDVSSGFDEICNPSPRC